LKYRKIADCATRQFPNSVSLVLSAATEVLHSLLKLKEENFESERTTNKKVHYISLSAESEHFGKFLV